MNTSTAPAITVLHGECIALMQEMPADSIDAIVTDPPYGLGFMGKKWDALPPGEAWARECLRVLKPGGHLLAFGGTRTWHRLAVAVEDAGFEIRDSLAWMHGTGFPKHRAGLKPAFEPVVMGRKPFKGSLLANEAVFGTGALNIDECRIGTEERTNNAGGTSSLHRVSRVEQGYRDHVTTSSNEATTVSGRWPANVLLDEHTAEILDAQSGISTSPTSTGRGASSKATSMSGTLGAQGRVSAPGDSGGASRFFYVAKAPKSERPIVDGIAHATVKPLALMRHLVKLVTPPGGTVLDPFAGTGTTLEAARLEGFDSIGIERESDYLPLIAARLNRQDKN